MKSNELNLLKLSDAVAELCKPLYKINIYYFCFARVYADGSHTSLCNNKDWFDHFISNNYHNSKQVLELSSSFDSFSTSHQIINMFETKVVKDALNFKIGNQISIIKKYKHYCDFYYFGSDPQNSWIINFYLKQFDLLENFILYFRDKGANLISEAEKNKFEKIKDNNIIALDEPKSKLFLDEIKIERFLFDGEFGEVFISAREMQTLFLLAKGLTIKEIGKILNISPRTVETYLDRLKTRIGCANRQELVTAYLKSCLYSSVLQDQINTL